MNTNFCPLLGLFDLWTHIFKTGCRFLVWAVVRFVAPLTSVSVSQKTLLAPMDLEGAQTLR
ncbi:MAG: hypothetical protein ACJAWC_000293 [Yoonia sp.]|jgi:hypothetical protein